jgi:hypothetical protein
MMDFLSISSWLAFWVITTLSGYWLVMRVGKMRLKRKGGNLVPSYEEALRDSGRDRSGLRRHR